MNKIHNNHEYEILASSAEIKLVQQKPPKRDVLNEIFTQVKAIYTDNYRRGSRNSLDDIYNGIIDLFAGKMAGFRKCDTEYHDLQHTIQSAIAIARVMDGWNKSSNAPSISHNLFDVGIVAALLHDTGYIKRLGDDTGTGGKYTFRHVARSAEFAAKYLTDLGYSRADVILVTKMIWCTCTKTDLKQVIFSSTEEQLIGFCLGTADFVCQMASPDYPEKLPLLFSEFSEGYEYEGTEKLRKEGYVMFDNVAKMIESTPGFYEIWVRNRFKEMASVYQYIPLHYEKDRNYYIDAIERNIGKITSVSFYGLV